MILELIVLYFDKALAKVVYFDIITTSKQNNEREKIMTNSQKRNGKLQVTLNQWIELHDKEMAISEDLRKNNEVEQALMMINKIKMMINEK